MKYNPKKHHRRSIRLKGYDYAKAGLYFITLCTQHRAHLFGHITDGKMQLNAYGKIAAGEWQHTEAIRLNCSIHEYIIMPNHIHGILEITFKKGEAKAIGTFQSPSHTIGSIIRGYKIATIKKIKDLILAEENKSGSGELRSQSTGELQFAPTAPTAQIKNLNFKIWQRNYYEHIIRDQSAYTNISRYILNNPQKWEDDKLNGGKGNQVLEPAPTYNQEPWMI